MTSTCAADATAFSRDLIRCLGFTFVHAKAFVNSPFVTLVFDALSCLLVFLMTLKLGDSVVELADAAR